MLGFQKRKAAAVTVQTGPQPGPPAIPLGAGERALYRSLRESVPVIDAAVYKLRRLIGEFTVTCPDERAQQGLQRFLAAVPVNAAGAGIHEFLGIYLEELVELGGQVYMRCRWKTLEETRKEAVFLSNRRLDRGDLDGGA